MPVLDLTGRTHPPALRLEWAPSFESLMSLCAFCLPEEDVGTLDNGPSWAAQVSSSASRELLASIGRLGADAGKAWVNFLGLAASPPPAVTPGELITRIEALSPLDVRLYLLGEHVPAYQGTLDREVLRRAAEGEGRAKARLLVDPTYFGGETRTHPHQGLKVLSVH